MNSTAKLESGHQMVSMQEGENRAEKSEPKNSSSHDAFINDLVKKQLESKHASNDALGDLLGDVPAPSSKINKYGLTTAKGIYKVPEGMWNSAVHSVKHPLDTLEIVGAAALMGAGLKVILPEAGPAGKIAGAVIGVYFTYQAAKPIMEAYSGVGTAKTLNELDISAMKIGNAGGEFIVHSAIAAGGYKIGAGTAENVLMRERFDRFADLKQGFWDGVVQKGKYLTDAVGITKTELPRGGGTVPVDPNLKEGTSRYWPSDKKPPDSAVLKGEINAAAEMEATVLLKSKGSDLAMDRTLKRINAGMQQHLTDAQIAAKFGPTENAITQINKFASENGLKIAESDLRSGRVILQGKAGEFSKAFQTPLLEYQSADGITFRGRQGAIALPNNLQPEIQGIYGLDNRPHARNYAVFPHTEGPPASPTPRAANGYLPNEIADAYKFPKESMGQGTSVAIIQLGGGIDMVNEAAYYKNNKLPMPEIQVISVGGAPTKAGTNPRFDGEVSLDSQVIGAIAPKAHQKVIFAPNTDAGFIDAVARGTFPAAAEKPTTSISISWGAPEEGWTEQGMRGLSQAFKKAAMKGISVFAAAGDDGAVNRAPSGKFNTDYPASDPNVTAAGGTRLEISGGKIRAEVAWNGSGGATGGGISQRFDRPDYQKGLQIPVNPQNPGYLGRGVPDIAGNADPSTGWKIRVGGVDQLSGGTSAVSPMLAALDARLSGALGRNVGPWNPFLYKAGMSGSNTFFNDIMSGDNNGYTTSRGWDPVTGWGSINGEKLLQALRSGSSTGPSLLTNFVPMPIVQPGSEAPVKPGS